MGGPIGRSLTLAFNFVPKFFFVCGLAQEIAPEVRAIYLAPWSQRAQRAAATIAPRQLVRASSYLQEVADSSQKLADRPTLIVWGTADFVFGELERARLERIFRNHVSVLFDKASHFLQEDKENAWRKLSGAFASPTRAVV